MYRIVWFSLEFISKSGITHIRKFKNNVNILTYGSSNVKKKPVV